MTGVLWELNMSVQFHSQVGKVVNGIKITGFAQRDSQGHPVYQGVCTKCGSGPQTFPHRDVICGAVRCKASICGKPVKDTRRARQPQPPTDPVVRDPYYWHRKLVEQGGWGSE